MKRGHRQSILGTGVRQTSRMSEPRHSTVSRPQWTSRPNPTPRPEHYTPPPQWRHTGGDPNIKRKWLMHIEDERGGDWRLPGGA